MARGDRIRSTGASKWQASHERPGADSFAAGQARRIVTHLSLDNYGPATIKDREVLIRHVKLAAQHGIATSDHELAGGIRSIAVPINPTPPGD